MPLPIGHGLVGASLFAATRKNFSLKEDWPVMAFCALLSVMPDMDFISDWVFHLRGWHRGFTHSILFGIAIGLAASLLFREQSFREITGIVSVPVSHGLLDALTTTSPGTGVELLWPFSSHRFKFGFVDYMEFRPNPGADPLSYVLIEALKVSMLELLIFTPVLLTVLYLRQRYGAS